MIAGMEMNDDVFMRLFPLQFYERQFAKDKRPDEYDRPLNRARDTIIELGLDSLADGSALVKIGCTTMSAVIKMEIITPSADSPDEGNLDVEFHMPLCSPSGRPAEAAPIIEKRLSDAILSSGMLNLKELCLVSGKAGWMVYLDIYCLDADGSLFDAALLSAVAAFCHVQIPVASLNEEGRVFIVSEEEEEGEESNIETTATVVMNSSGELVSFDKLGGTILADSAIRDCFDMTRERVKELKQILQEAIRNSGI